MFRKNDGPMDELSKVWPKPEGRADGVGLVPALEHHDGPVVSWADDRLETVAATAPTDGGGCHGRGEEEVQPEPGIKRGNARATSLPLEDDERVL